MRAATQKAEPALREPGMLRGADAMEPAPADRAQDDRPPPHVITPAEAPSRARMRERSAPLPASPVLLGTLVAILDAVAIGGAGLAADALAA